MRTVRFRTSLLALTILGAVAASAPAQNYHFNGPVPRDVLENYLARSITFLDLLTEKGDFDDNLRMLKHTGAKFVGRSVYRWGGEADLPRVLTLADKNSRRVHEMDADIVLQACLFEIVSIQVERLAIPPWTFEAFGMPAETRNFVYEAMLYDDGKFHNHWSKGASVPDISRRETQLWFYFLARSYINVGMEALHFGQAELMNRADPESKHWTRVLDLVRRYADKHARRHWVLCDAHVPSGGLLSGDRLLFDFHSFPLRIKEVPESPQEGILEVGFTDAIYGRSLGGIAPSGWRCEHLPYLVEIDNWGVSDRPGQPGVGGCWVWGYDEMSWFAHQPQEYRNQWLRYAWKWIRDHDPAGYLQMPGSRIVHAPVNGEHWYFANMRSDAVPDGAGQEETIREIWAAAALATVGSTLHGQEPLPGDTFLNNGVTAHRGSSIELPENTIAAFQAGIDAGADWLELDIFRTQDGKIVVIHDLTTERVGDKRLVVPESTYEKLLTVDVATDFRRRNGKSPQEVPKHTIPLLEDVLQLIMAQQDTRVSIQPKMPCVADAIALVRKLKAEPWVGFNDGNLDYMAEVKRLAPEIPVFWDRGQSDMKADLQIAKAHGFRSIVVNHRVLTKQKIDQIHEAGLEAGAWTVNDRTTMLRLLDQGIDRIYTDDPRLLLQLIAARQFRSVACEGTYPKHLQGVCTNDRDAIYWSFTDVLVKTGLDGKVLEQIPVANHHGDLCHMDGRIYVAVNLGQFNQPAGKADSWVYVYDAETLEQLARHETREVVHGAGGMAHRNGHFFIVGGLPPGTNENYVYEYDQSFRFVKRHVLASGYTLMGIQTAAFAEDHWWFGCYGRPQVLLKGDESFQVVGNWQFDCSLGVVGLADGRFLIAEGKCTSGEGCTGALTIALPAPQTGFRRLTPQPGSPSRD